MLWPVVGRSGTLAEGQLRAQRGVDVATVNRSRGNEGILQRGAAQLSWPRWPSFVVPWSVWRDQVVSPSEHVSTLESRPTKLLGDAIVGRDYRFPVQPPSSTSQIIAPTLGIFWSREDTTSLAETNAKFGR